MEHVSDPQPDPRKVWNFLKEYGPILILLAIVLFGFTIRVYHVGYPVVGYHNWKEAHYLTEARNFAQEGFFEYGFFVPSRDYARAVENPQGVHSDSFPTIPIIIGLLFKIFGANLVIARLVGIFFVTATIPLMYALTKKIFHREDAALFSAFLFAINPLFVFFSHNVQLINAAIFFLILSLYLFELWRDNRKSSYLLLAAASFTLASLTKYTFAILGVIILLRFPYNEFKNKANYKTFAIATAIVLLFGVWFLYSNYYIPSAYGIESVVTGNSVQIGKAFTPQFISSFKIQILDNYTLPLWWLALLGVIPTLLFARKMSFPLHYLIAGIIFVPLAASKINGHSYHQYPIGPLVILLAVFFVMFSLDTVFKFVRPLIKNKAVESVLRVVVIVAISFLIYQQSAEAWDRQFDTQFDGLDVAGEYIQSHKQPGDTLIHSSHQAYGVLWHGDIMGSRGIPSKVEQIELLENERGAQWAFVYQWDFNRLDSPEFDYISDNYRLVQVGLREGPQGTVPLYLLLRRGGTFNFSQLPQTLQNKTVGRQNYELTQGDRSITFVNVEP